MIPKLVLLSSLAIAISAYSIRPSVKTTLQDAQDQVTEKLRCWEFVNPGHNDIPGTGGFVLSEPIYELCSYMPHPKDYNKYWVSGLDMDSDDYTKIMEIYKDQTPVTAVLNVCVQQALQTIPVSQIALLCMCKRSGCNIPGTLLDFLDYNKHPMPSSPPEWLPMTF